MQCIICSQEIKNNFLMLNCQCQNSYHKECILPWINQHRNCPTCRRHWRLNPYQQQLKLITEINRRLHLESIGINSDRHYHDF